MTAWLLAGTALTFSGLTFGFLALDWRLAVLGCGAAAVLLWVAAGLAFYPRSGGGLGPG